MLSYDEFKEAVKNLIKEYLPSDYADRNVNIADMSKNNGTVESQLTIPATFIGKQVIAPSVHLSGFYEDYKKTEDLEAVMKSLADVYVAGDKNAPSIDLNDIFKKENISIRLINTNANKEMLKTAPHKEFEDLSAVYELKVNNLGEGTEGSILIKNEILDKIEGATKENIFDIAKENIFRDNAPVIKPMREMIIDMMVKDGMPREMAENLCPDDMPMYIISNANNSKGASGILFEETLDEATKIIGGDFAILPSSIHEVICVPVEGMSFNELRNMVKEVNQTQVAENERLSDNVYIYRSNEKEKGFQLVTEDKVKDLER